MKRIGIFGTGFWGRLAQAAAEQLPDVTVARVWSRTRDNAEALAQKLDCEVGDDVAGLDAVVVALPPVAVPDVARRCLAAGVPCLLEKPVSLDAAVVRELAVAFDEQDVRAAVNLQDRFAPAMDAVRTAAASGEYGRLLEVDVTALGNRGSTASPDLHSWQHRAEDGGGVAGISGPHAAEFLVSLAGPGRVDYARAWIEVPERADAAGVMRRCTAHDNVEVLTTHGDVRGRLRLGTTARKKEETWTARCEGGTLRVGADDRPVLVENFGKTSPLPFEPADLDPSLVLLRKFLRGDADVPDLHLMADCMDLL